ncbi:NAD(P)H-hydrate dehydratase [Meiothermus sp. QL-1]|uniref:NAD(P)H-hydrate dehydratase n=1 Tax=Meiothermus sp. QL-1 TaxID=2058095 RepID=UPI000E0B9B38|nr:NAD(P)H-hydrate dehydratase [Meiothermus sp. QL-1]RDI96156.1 NAD(P)H-hydrate dehydratase [Meiothermus sp. QL-1]
MRLFTPEAMREADRRAVELGYPSLLLMEAAGRQVAEWVLRAYPGRKAVVLAGRGNNGGDGLVAARWLALWGQPVEVFAAEGQAGDAAVARRALEALGLAIRPLAEWRPEPQAVVVDALFGTGLRGPLEGFYAELVERLNALGGPVVSVDLPSGLPYTPHVRAHLTVALAGLKTEHLFYPQRSACGRIVLAPIGMPPRALENPALPELLNQAAMRALLPVRPGDAHKGSVGRVLVAGGYRHYTGAPSLAALGAYRAGAGLVTVAYPADCPVEPPLEAVRLPVEGWRPECLREARAEAVAVGMGAGAGGEAAAMAALGLARPTVLDADALHPPVLEAYRAAGVPAVVTPHPGEASRLLGWPSREIAGRPLEAAQALARRYAGLVVVLKGGPTVLAWADRLAVNPSGNPAMATGGMGDVLSGVIAALLAAGLAPWDAARLGVYLHGLAGDRVGRVGLLAHEVADVLPEAQAALREGGVRDFWEP